MKNALSGALKLAKNTRVNFELSYVMNSYEEETKIELFGNKGSIVWPNNSYYVLKKNKLIKKKFNYKKELASKLQIKTTL